MPTHARTSPGRGAGPLARIRRSAGPLACGGLVLVTACGMTPVAAPPSGSGQAERSRLSGTVTVFAAASLARVSLRWEAELEAAHPGLDVVVVLDGSSGLARQLLDGARADVFLSADARTMATVAQAGLAGAPLPLARNEVVVAVPESNPGLLRTAGDVGRPGLDVALCDEPVPCGAAARRALAALDVDLVPVTEEASVSAVLTRVRLGEVDAGLVYATDAAAAAGEVRALPLPAAAAAAGSTTYQVASLRDAPNPDAAAAVVAHVLGAGGQDGLDDAGFGRP